MSPKDIKETIERLDEIKAQADRAIEAANTIRDNVEEAVGFLLADEADPLAGLWDLIGPEIEEIDRQTQEVKGAAADLDDLM